MTRSRNPWPARFLVLSALLGVADGISDRTASASERPNVVIFLVDDMGLMDTSVPFLTDADGNPQRFPLNDFYRTPNMERLASQGIRFNQFYAMSVCSPTRVSIMTGQNAARHRVTNWINPQRNNAGPQGPPAWNWQGLTVDDVTLPAVLRQHGYRTMHIGKGHFGALGFSGADPQNLGFDVNVAGGSFGAPGSYYGSKRFGLGTKRQQHAVPHLQDYHDTDTFLTEALTLEAKKLVTQAAESQQPFFLYLSHYAVHAPFESDPRFAAYYRGSDKSAPAQAFATLIEGMDKSLGDLLDHLHRVGIAEQTMILFLSDNGSDAPLGQQHEVASSEPLRGKKGSHYEGGVRVPMIAAWAKPDPSNRMQADWPIPHDVVQPQLATVMDLFPTMMELTGCTPPADHVLDGSSLRNLFRGQSDASRAEQFLLHYPHAPHRSNYFTTWRDGHWKVIYHALPNVPTHDGSLQHTGHYQLFHLANDPYEANDLASAEPERLRVMMEGLLAALEQYDSLHPISDSGQLLLPLLP